MRKTVGVILASGSGERFHCEIPKQFVKLNGKYVVQYCLDEFVKSRLFDEIVVVVNDLSYKYVFDKYNVHIVKGGDTRTKSVYNAIKCASQFKPKYILFHDAVRPLIKSEDLKQYIDLLKAGNTSVVTAEEISDSLHLGDREKFKLIQTPEAFEFSKLYEKYDSRKSTTAIYQQLLDEKLAFVKLSHPNYKITYQYDLFMLEHMVKYAALKIERATLMRKKILIFGGSGDIGSCLVNRLSKFHTVYAPKRSEIDLKNFIAPKYGDVDVIINAAGAYYNDSQGILKHYNEIMNVNVRANLQILEYAKTLKNRPVSVVLIGSSSSTMGRKNLTLYSASKVALNSVVESLAEKLSEQEIFVNVICPEKVDTKLLKRLHNAEVDKREVITVDDVADAVMLYIDTREFGKIVYLKKGFDNV